MKLLILRKIKLKIFLVFILLSWSSFEHFVIYQAVYKRLFVLICYIYIYMRVCVCVYLSEPQLWAGCDTSSIFKWCKVRLNSEFKFS